MKKTFSILLMAVVCLFCCSRANAHHVMCFGEFSIDGLDYAYFDDTKKSVYVTFAHASHLKGTKVVIPDTVEWLNVKYPVKTVASEAFHHCPEVDSIIVSPNIEFINHKAFTGTKWENNLPDGPVYLGNHLYKYNGAMPEEFHYNIEPGTKSVTERAFEGYTNLREINFPASVKRLHVNVFEGCTNLKEITIYSKDAPADFAKETFFESDGYGHEVINKSVKDANLFIPKGSLDSYTRAGYHLVVKSIREMEFDPFSFEVISEKEMTAKVSANKMVELSGEIIIPDTANINGNPYKVTTIPADAFAGYEKLTKVTLPTSISEIGERAFMGCKALKESNIPNGVTAIPAEVFADCESLVTVAIPRTVETIDKTAFRNCNNLDEATQESIVKDYINAIYIIGAIIVILLILFLIKRIKRGKKAPKICEE